MKPGEWLAKVKERDWKKVGRTSLVVFGILAGNAAAVGVLDNLNGRIGNLEKTNAIQARINARMAAELATNKEMHQANINAICLTGATSGSEIWAGMPPEKCEEFADAIMSTWDEHVLDNLPSR